jgi:crotonobetainyl-CoA:carnitine CoA-transferase CaiB-like acyl-CoA transferase
VRFYRAKDQWVGVAARSQVEEEAFVVACGALTGEADEIAGRIAGMSAIDVVDRLSIAGVPATVALTRAEALEDGFLNANGIIRVMSVPDQGRFAVVSGFCTWGTTEAPSGQGARLGADTLAVLKRVGVTNEQIVELTGRGAAVI